MTGDTLELDDLIEIKSSKSAFLPSHDIVRAMHATLGMQQVYKMKSLSPKTTYQLEAVDEPSGDDYTTSSDPTCTSTQAPWVCIVARSLIVGQP